MDEPHRIEELCQGYDWRQSSFVGLKQRCNVLQLRQNMLDEGDETHTLIVFSEESTLPPR